MPCHLLPTCFQSVSPKCMENIAENVKEKSRLLRTFWTQVPVGFPPFTTCRFDLKTKDQRVSSDVQFNTTVNGVAVSGATGMGNRNLLPSGLTSQPTSTTPAWDSNSIPLGLNTNLGRPVRAFGS